MCRSIKQLRRPDEAPTEEEIQAAARQYVRKVSGYRTPSRANQVVFESAVAQIADATRTLLGALDRSANKDATPNMLPAPVRVTNPD